MEMTVHAGHGGNPVSCRFKMTGHRIASALAVEAEGIDVTNCRLFMTRWSISRVCLAHLPVKWDGVRRVQESSGSRQARVVNEGKPALS
jgi:hypothetical protein